MVGIDGARGGWVGVCWDGTDARPVFASELVDLLELATTTLGGAPAAVAVDMPIQLGTTDLRPCDVEARPLLGPRRSSLFAPPALAALDFESYSEANAWSKATLGRGISKQAWMLTPKIREVRAVVAAGVTDVYETFPELSFRALNGDVPLAHPKRSWTGMMSRLGLLADAGITVPVDAGAAGAVAADDMIDAGALAWSAMRIARGEAVHVPADCADGQPSIWW